MVVTFLIEAPLLSSVLFVAATLVVYNWWYRTRKLEVDYRELYILITGCDTGFGNKAALKFDRLGFNVFASCLSEGGMAGLSAQCSARLRPFRLDVTDDASIKNAFEFVSSTLPPNKGLWAVINNAGIMGTVGACEWLTKKHYEQTLEVNVYGVASITSIFLPLVRKAQGRLVYMSSILGRVPMVPASYCVSKFCLEGYVNCLRNELFGDGVSVHLIEPGGYRTNVTDPRLLMKSMTKTYDGLDEDVKLFYGEDYKRQLANLMSLAQRGVWGRDLDEVADVYVHTVTSQHPKTRYVVGLNGNLLFRPLLVLPTRLVDFIFGMAYPTPAKRHC